MSGKRLINVQKQSKKTIRELYNEYLNYCISIGQAEGTIKSKKSFFTFSLSKIVNLDDNISTFTKDKLENHIIEMRRKGYSGNYYQTTVIRTKGFLTYCFNNHYLEKYEVKIPTITQNKKEVYSEEEIVKLIKKPNLKKCLIGEYRSWCVVNFAIATGARSETILNVLVKDIDFINNSILFRHMKARKQITVPLSPTLRGILKEYIQLLGLEGDSILFSKLNGKKMPYDTLHQTILTYCQNRNVQMKGINTFRNTYATMFIKNGNNNIYLLQKLLGHSDIKMTERYINLLPTQMKEDVNKYNPLDVLNKKRLRINK